MATAMGLPRALAMDCPEPMAQVWAKMPPHQIWPAQEAPMRSAEWMVALAPD